MAYCSNCGSKLEENAKFCLACGTPTEQTENSTTINTAPVEEATPAPAKASGVLNMGMLIWAIINLISCCTPLGIAGLVLTILAKDAPSAEEEAKKLKTAKTCNLIGTIGGAVYILGCIIVGVIMGLAEYL
ncbi:MAG: zinc-ribbon domain-containing protein [Clostridia bacterium]|nr:zinc-ribbon domain-containing protein [Clostridia bacterium]